jgi:phosphohistidine phosphatase SixA
VNIYLIRHAHAGERSRWNGDDAERPLSAKGRDQADDITESLEASPVTRIVSSPALRCQQTVAGLAHRRQLDVEVDDAFGEGASWRPARERLDAFASAGEDAVVCSHGDLLPELLEVLAHEGVVLHGSGCAKGSIWQLVVRDGRIEDAHYHRHPERDALRGD